MGTVPSHARCVSGKYLSPAYSGMVRSKSSNLSTDLINGIGHCLSAMFRPLFRTLPFRSSYSSKRSRAMLQYRAISSRNESDRVRP